MTRPPECTPAVSARESEPIISLKPITFRLIRGRCIRPDRHPRRPHRCRSTATRLQDEHRPQPPRAPEAGNNAVGLGDQGPHIRGEGIGRRQKAEVAINALSGQHLLRVDPNLRGSPRSNGYLGNPPSIMQLDATYHPGTVSNRHAQIGTFALVWSANG